MTREEFLEAARLEEGLFISAGGAYRRRTPEEARAAYEAAGGATVTVPAAVYQQFHSICQHQGIDETHVVGQLISQWNTVQSNS